MPWLFGGSWLEKTTVPRWVVSVVVSGRMQSKTVVLSTWSSCWNWNISCFLVKTLGWWLQFLSLTPSHIHLQAWFSNFSRRSPDQLSQNGIWDDPSPSLHEKSHAYFGLWCCGTKLHTVDPHLLLKLVGYQRYLTNLTATSNSWVCTVPHFWAAQTLRFQQKMEVLSLTQQFTRFSLPHAAATRALTWVCLKFWVSQIPPANPQITILRVSIAVLW